MSEFEFIDWIKKQNCFDDSVLLGIGDDAALLSCADMDAIAISTDTIMQGVDFELTQENLFGIGWKSLCISLSDIAAMGLPALAATCAMAIPPGVSRADLEEIYRGMKAAADQFHCPVVGGDLSTAPHAALTVTSTVLGKKTTTGKAALSRSTAQVDDILVVSGELGGSLLGRHLCFEPRLALACYLNEHYPIHSMIDISDGLSGDLKHICQASGLGSIVHAKHIPIAAAAEERSKNSGQTALYHALHDGEDFELLFTLPAEAWESLSQDSNLPKKTPVTAIGRITQSKTLLLEQAGKQNTLTIHSFHHKLAEK